MQYGLNLVTLGEYADPRRVCEIARHAEAAGWEALFIWDHLAFAWGVPSGDPWVILAAVAAATTTLRMGPAVTPVPRRRLQVLANSVATLDLLNQGRTIFGAGLGGVEAEYEAFGEECDARRRAARLDEALPLLDRLWRGQAVTHRGPHYTLDNVTLAPLPAQHPRPPIWIGGESRPALRRAARWDGWVIGGDNEQTQMVKTPEALAEQCAYIGRHRTAQAPFDVALSGCSRPGDGRLVQEYAHAGATWWLESIHGMRGDHGAMLARIDAGPPG